MSSQTTMPSLPTTTEILIVGGGPTGLALALALQKNGCKEVVIVDAIEAGENTSRAMAMHAATLEVCHDTVRLIWSLLTTSANRPSIP